MVMGSLHRACSLLQLFEACRCWPRPTLVTAADYRSCGRCRCCCIAPHVRSWGSAQSSLPPPPAATLVRWPVPANYLCMPPWRPFPPPFRSHPCTNGFRVMGEVVAQALLDGFATALGSGPSTWGGQRHARDDGSVDTVDAPLPPPMFDGNVEATSDK